MATGAQGIERIAEAMGRPVVTVDTASRVLKQHTPPMWALARRGGGKGAKHLEADHLVNLVLALAWSDPITNAPAVVSRLRAMQARTPPKHMRHVALSDGHTGLISSDLPIRTAVVLVAGGPVALGDTLGAIVYGMATRPDKREQFRREGLELRLETWPYESAVLTRRDGADTITETFDGLGLLAGAIENAPEAALRRSVTIPFALLNVLADLCADTIARREPTPSLPISAPASTTAGPETENAGSTTEPAPSRAFDRDRTKATSSSFQDVEHLEAREVGERDQSPESLLSGHSTAFWSAPDGRHHPADLACV